MSQPSDTQTYKRFLQGFKLTAIVFSLIPPTGKTCSGTNGNCKLLLSLSPSPLPYLPRQRDFSSHSDVLSSRPPQGKRQEGRDDRHACTRTILGRGPFRDVKVNVGGVKELI